MCERLAGHLAVRRKGLFLNWVPLGVEAVKGWPLKKVAWMSLGAMGFAAKAALAVRRMFMTANVPTRIISLRGQL
jgi:hypothetical protein